MQQKMENGEPSGRARLNIWLLAARRIAKMMWKRCASANIVKSEFSKKNFAEIFWLFQKTFPRTGS